MNNNNWVSIPLTVTEKIGQWAIWASTRLLVATPALLFESWYQLSRLSLHLSDMARKSYSKALLVYDSLPYGGIKENRLIEAETKPVIPELPNINNDIVSALEGKHALIVGETGTGKSTLAQFLGYSVGGRVTVYDADASPDEWRGLEVIGRCADFKAIQVGMESDLEDLQNQLNIRGEKGDAALAGSERCLIAEEFPLLVDEVEIASTWLKKHAMRGRKPKRFVIALAQTDSVKAWGLEGDGGLRKCFRFVRLGKVAITYAKSLKNEALVTWLRADRSRCLIDDEPYQLPLYRELKAVTHQLPRLPVSAAITMVETEVTEFSSDSEIALWRSISAHINSGRGESWIIKEILGYQGSQYQRGKEIFASLKERFS